LDLHITEISPLDMTSCCYYPQEEDIRNEHVTSVMFEVMSQNVQVQSVQLIKLQFQQQTMQRCNDATMQGEAMQKLCLAARKILLRGLQSRMLIRFVSAWTMHRKCHLQKKLNARKSCIQIIQKPQSKTCIMN